MAGKTVGTGGIAEHHRKELAGIREAPGIDAAFVCAVATGDRSLLLSPYEDALKTAAVTLAANRSAEEGGRLIHL